LGNVSRCGTHQQNILRYALCEQQWNLFKGDHLDNKCADLKFNSLLEDYYNCYELKTNSNANDWSDLVSLTDKINNTATLSFTTRSKII